MRWIDGHKHFVPLAVVQTGSNEHTFPLVQQGWVQIKPTIDQFQDITVDAASRTATAAKHQNTIRQRRTESQIDVIAFNTIRIDGYQATRQQRHRGALLASFALETSRTRTIENVIRFVLQRWTTDAIVLAWIICAASQTNRTILATKQLIAFAQVVANAILAFTMHTRLIPIAFVDFFLANNTFVAQITFACVGIDLYKSIGIMIVYICISNED